MSSPLPVTLTGNISDVEVARLSWIEKTTPEERKAIGEVLRKHDTSTIVGLNAMVAELTILILVGEIPPSTALAAKPFIEFIAANTWQVMAQAGHSGRASSAVTETIFQLREKVRLTPRYTKGELPEHHVVDEQELTVTERVEVG